MLTQSTRHDSFTEFAREVEPRLRRALVAGYGTQKGREAAADALVYAWRKWDKVELLDNPAGYLYRVGQRYAKKRRSQAPLFTLPAPTSEPWIEPELPNALARLSTRQRAAVLLHHSFEWTYAEIGELLGLSLSTVRNHCDRGMKKLQSALEVPTDG